MAWIRVITRKDHRCTVCEQTIPAGTHCPSRSSTDNTGKWHTEYRCPGFSCYFDPADRAKLLAPARAIQVTLL